MRKKLTVLMLTGTAALAMGGISHARSVSALLGQTSPPGNIGCLDTDLNMGRVLNRNCGQVRWTLGLPLDSNGGHTGSISVNAPDFNATFCRAVGVGRDGSGASASPFRLPVSINTFVDIPFSVNVPSSGLMFADCFLGAGAMVTKSDHTPN